MGGRECSLLTFRSESSKLSSSLPPPSETFVKVQQAGEAGTPGEMLKLQRTGLLPVNTVGKGG